MIPLRVQQILMELVGVSVKHKKCRSHTLKKKMCSKKRLNGSFFCHCHSKLPKLAETRTFSETLLVLCEMLKVQKYKYPVPVPGPQLGSRILYKLLYNNSLDKEPASRRWAWFAATVDGYKKGEHTLNFDDGQIYSANIEARDWIYSDTTDVYCGNRRICTEKLKKDAQRILMKYGGFDGVYKTPYFGTKSRLMRKPTHYRIATYPSRNNCFYLIGCARWHRGSIALELP